MHAWGCRGQKRAPDALKLELQTAASIKHPSFGCVPGQWLLTVKISQSIFGHYILDIKETIQCTNISLT